MSSSQITSQSQQYAMQPCPSCGMALPATAAFCGKCGERLERPAQHAKEMFSIDRPVNLEHYRITSLMRRLPYVQLSLAIDTQQQRPVAIRDIDIQQIDAASRSHILQELQQEYDILRQHKNNDVLPLIASFHAENHLYSISAWPHTIPPQKGKNGQAPHIYTLQDLLQSGVGLPEEQIAVNWVLRLANAVAHLHSNQIVIGTLDPTTILVNPKDYSGQPTLFPSWLLPTVQAQIQQTSNSINASLFSHMTADRTAFFSPEAKLGWTETRSDIYSLGALLYLLMTGISPSEKGRATAQQLRSPREINPRIQHTLATLILKALAGQPSARFQSVNEFVAALLEQQGQTVQTRLDTNEDTVPIPPPPQDSARHDLSHTNAHQAGQEPLNVEHEEPYLETGYSEQTIQRSEEMPPQPQNGILGTAIEVAPRPEESISLPNTAGHGEDEQHMDNQAAIKGGLESQPTVTDREQHTQKQNDYTAHSPASLPSETFQQDKQDLTTTNKTLAILFQRVKHFVLGGQPRTNNAVAMIETPMRIQPNTNYTIRIHIMGRNEPKRIAGVRQSNNNALLGGLGSLSNGEQVHIEVRSALYHNYAYIVQQTDVKVPAANYAAEITIPLRSITDATGNKRERLHIFFTDQNRKPLYEKPFVIELFISNLVQSGNEGHNVLSIPL